MAADDYHVLVVVVRRAEAKIVRASDHTAIIAKRNLASSASQAPKASFEVMAPAGTARESSLSRVFLLFFFGLPGSPTTVTLPPEVPSSSSSAFWSACPP